MSEEFDIRASIIHNLIFTNTKVSLDDFEDELPSLPLPPLKNTLQKYLISVKPFLSEKEFTSTQSIVNEFESGAGKQLQSILEQRAKEKRNWLEEWWYNYAYLMTRDPLIPTSNMACNHPLNLNLWPPVEENALKYGAISIWIVMEMFNNIRKGLLRPHYSLNGEKLSMCQFNSHFNMNRCPEEYKDELKTSFKLDHQGSSPGHVIILCNGHIWTLDPFDENGEQLQVNELEKLLEFIRTESHSMSTGPEVAALTLSNRDLWATNRKHLISVSAKNANSLSIIENAVFHMTLEDTRLNSVEEAYANGLCGFSANRWADKTYSMIIYANGYVASNSEHSPVDAMVSVVIGHYAIELLRNEIGAIWKKEKVLTRDVAYPKRLQFDLDGSIVKKIQSTKKDNFALQKQIDARYLIFASFGKDWIKSKKVHPDTFVQAALQLVYYTMHKQFAPTYETATTRKFFHGRTETIRSCTVEMVDFVKSMTSPIASISEKKSKMLKAMKMHLENIRECQNGQGIDRHMMGLYITALENGFEIPRVFTDPAYTKSGGGGKYILSTSTVGTGYAVGGVVPMVKNGYAVMYSFLPDRINFTITCYLNSGACTEGFISTLERTLVQLKDLLEMPESHL